MSHVHVAELLGQAITISRRDIDGLQQKLSMSFLPWHTVFSLVLIVNLNNTYPTPLQSHPTRSQNTRLTVWAHSTSLYKEKKTAILMYSLNESLH